MADTEDEEEHTQEMHDATRDATERAIGRFITEFSTVEFAMRYYLAQAINLDLNWLRPLISHDFAMLCSAIDNIFCRILQTDEDRKRVKAFINRVRSFNDMRVKVVHGMWTEFVYGGMVTHTSRQNFEMKDYRQMAELLQQQVKEGEWLFIEVGHLGTKCQDLTKKTG